MHRSKKIVVTCHCLLNANAKIFPLATCGGVYRTEIDEYLDEGVGFLQLPCPETCYLGMNRWGMTREQYDHQAFRTFCRDLLMPALAQIRAFRKAGYAILGVIGMDGSPNCGVARTCTGFTGGEICSASLVGEQAAKLRLIHGPGVFIEVFQTMLTEAGISLAFTAVAETPSASDSLHHGE